MNLSSVKPWNQQETVISDMTAQWLETEMWRIGVKERQTKNSSRLTRWDISLRISRHLISNGRIVLAIKSWTILWDKLETISYSESRKITLINKIYYID